MKRDFLLPFAGLTAALVLLGASCNQPTTAPSMEESAQADVNATAEMMDHTGSEEMAMTTIVDGNYEVNPTESKMNWKASKVTGEHFGNILISQGSFTVENGVPVSGRFVIDMDSMTILDLEPGAMHDNLANHLRSDDFFSVSTYPEATFEIANVESITGNQYQMNGVLTIKGIAKPVSFPVMIMQEEAMLRATGMATIDRTDFDIQFRSGKFFEDLGDSLIHDEFTLELDLVAQAS